MDLTYRGTCNSCRKTRKLLTRHWIHGSAVYLCKRCGEEPIYLAPPNPPLLGGSLYLLLVGFVGFVLGFAAGMLFGGEK